MVTGESSKSLCPPRCCSSCFRRALKQLGYSWPAYNAAAKAFYRQYLLQQRKQSRRTQAASRLPLPKRAPQKTYVYLKAWRQRHLDTAREIDRVHKHRRNAQKRQTLATFTRADWQRMLGLYGHRCVYCGKKSQRLTQDHVIPLSQGGDYTWENIVPACRACNSRKYTRGAPLFQPVLPFT